MKHKRQHIVPACYLSAWLEPVTPPGQQRAIWKFAKDGSGAHRRSPKKTFVESDRFTVWLKSGERDLKVEHRLCEIENQFSEVLRRLHRGEKISIRDKAKLAVFTAAMLGRSRRAADHWKKVWADLRSEFPNPEESANASQATEAPQQNDPLPTGAVRISAKILDEFLVNSHPEHVADTIEFASSVLFGMNLHFFSAKDEVGFLTSDEPCIMHNPTAYRYHPMMRSPGLRQRHVEVVLPLSPRLLMVFSHQLAPPRIYSLSQQEVDQVNVVVVLAVTAASACIIPAWRASQLDPAQALRAE
jgi:Protein of unknown function (DUF4238)